MAKTPSDEQREYINARGRIVLTACPGSGKTSAVCWKVQKHLSEWTPTSQGILILSFTNAAVREIEKGVMDLIGHALPEPHRIMTIDSCTNGFFTLPFARSIVGSPVDLRIAEDDDAINRARSWHRNEWMYKARKNTPFRYFLEPAKVNYTISGELEAPPKEITKQVDSFKAYMQSVKDWQRQHGLLTTRDSAYFALKVLRQHPSIPKAFVQRFPVIIIDEAQDSSEIQNALIDELVNAGLDSIDIVGDPNQSIYEFRGATPALFKARASQVGWTALTFSQNRRSTQAVIDAYQHLRAADEPAIVPLTEFTPQPVVIYHYDEGEEERVVSEFKHYTSAVAERGLAIVTRAHKTRADIQGTESECQPWKADYADPLLKAILALSVNDFATAVRQGRKFFFLATQGTTTTPSAIERERIDPEPIKTNATVLKLLRGLPNFELSTSAWTAQAQAYLSGILGSTVDLQIKQARANSYFTREQAESPFRQVMINGREVPIDVRTVHDVKGNTVGGLLLFLTAYQVDNLLTAIASRSEKGYLPDEATRIAYVAMSRPETHLCIAIPTEVPESCFDALFPTEFEVIPIIHQASAEESSSDRQ